eukprot:4123778-Karenia_brevis.AAC.1
MSSTPPQTHAGSAWVCFEGSACGLWPTLLFSCPGFRAITVLASTGLRPTQLQHSRPYTVFAAALGLS